MRKLAHIEVIEDIMSIDKADNIEVVKVLGWLVVCKKNEFKIGDKVIYFEIDSILPAGDPVFEFLGSIGGKFKEYHTDKGYKVFGHKLKTVKLRKQISQGLVLSVSHFPKLSKLSIGTDVSETLNINKFEVPENTCTRGFNKGKFPEFIRKTDQERVQNIWRNIENDLDKKWEITNKLDGSSATYYYKDGKLGLCSRNIELKTEQPTYSIWQRFKYWVTKRKLPVEDLNTVWHQMEKKYNIFKKLEILKMNIAIQGEIISPSIQGNYEQIKETMFYAFNIFDIDKQEYIIPNNSLSFISKLNDGEVNKLDYVPVLEYDKSLRELGLDTLEKVLEYAEGPSLLNPKVKREGVVFCSMETQESFKSISNSYLLHKDKKGD